MLKITANKKQIAAHINAAVEIYLANHPKPETFFGVKVHTNQQEARDVKTYISTFESGYNKIDSDTLLKALYENFVANKKGELADSLALAIHNCLDQSAFNVIVRRIASATLGTGASISDKEIMRAVLDENFGIEPEKASCQIM